jgi:hypothetical protein
MLSTQPLETGSLPHKNSSMKPHELDQIQDEDQMDASTKESTTKQMELILEQPKVEKKPVMSGTS